MNTFTRAEVIPDRLAAGQRPTLLVLLRGISPLTFRLLALIIIDNMLRAAAVALRGCFLIAAAASLCLAAKPLFERTDLFASGEAGVHTYRIPALLQTKRGTLIAIVDARRDSARDLPARISLVMRRSFDKGHTWTPPRFVVQPPEGGVGDASLLLERETGRVWCFFSYGPPGIGFRTAKAGTRTGPTTFQIHAMHSGDDGQTWSEPQDLTPQIKDPAWEAAFVTSGTHMETTKGRFLLPLVVRYAGNTVSARNAYSDDRGKTWHVGQPLGAGTDESHAVELKDGTILQNFRDSQTRLVGLSKDGGITVENLHHDPVLIEPGCNAGFARDTHSGKDALIFTNPASHVRQNMTVRLSFDSGQTWPQSRVLFAGRAAYSSTIALDDGTVAVLYESGIATSTDKITFARFNLEWVRQAADTQ